MDSETALLRGVGRQWSYGQLDSATEGCWEAVELWTVRQRY